MLAQVTPALTQAQHLGSSALAAGVAAGVSHSSCPHAFQAHCMCADCELRNAPSAHAALPLPSLGAASGCMIRLSYVCSASLRTISRMQGDCDPVSITQAVLDFLSQHNDPKSHSGGKLAWFSMWGEGALAAAEASAARWRAGEPLSVLDGIPYAVKDSQDAQEYPTCAGTTFMHLQCAPISTASI